MQILLAFLLIFSTSFAANLDISPQTAFVQNVKVFQADDVFYALFPSGQLYRIRTDQRQAFAAWWEKSGSKGGQFNILNSDNPIAPYYLVTQDTNEQFGLSYFPHLNLKYLALGEGSVFLLEDFNGDTITLKRYPDNQLLTVTLEYPADAHLLSTWNKGDAVYLAAVIAFSPAGDPYYIIGHELFHYESIAEAVQAISTYQGNPPPIQGVWVTLSKNL